ncbi:phosphoribosyltransferase [Melissospora conviva]|uniref:phosphoribosyltransferase n=1 Tax=Melissospora conviva TaxID=3388432 RepID=UPI003C240595
MIHPFHGVPGVLDMFIWPAFQSDSRANRLKAYEVGTSMTTTAPQQWVDLCGPEEAATQVELAFASHVKQVEVPEDRRSDWSHRFLLPQGIPGQLIPLLKILEKYFTLTKVAHLDFAMAFNWYKIPQDGVEPSKWRNSTAGELVHRSKYYRNNPSAQRDALNKLIDGTAQIIEKHPLLAASPTVVTVPGSAGDGRSVGEKYAAGVAARTGKSLVSTICTTGARKPAKEAGSAHLEGTFFIDVHLDGSVIVIDDVCRTGGTFRATALAARQAGATSVFGLAAVRTLRN